MERTKSRETPDVITELKPGDVIHHKGKNYKVIKPEKGWIRHEVWVRFNNREGGTDLVPSGNVADVFQNKKPGDKFRYSNGLNGTYLGEVQFREAYIKVADPNHPVPLFKEDIKHLHIFHMLSGDPKALKSRYHEDHINMANATITKAPPSTAKTYPKLSKWELIPYVVFVNGPMMRDDILEQVQKIQGRPYVPGSNTSYFGNYQHPGVVARDLLKVSSKSGNALVYDVGEQGRKVAQAIVAKIGEEPGKIGARDA